MSGSDWKARDKNRDAAIEVVEAAWADGQIVQADRDHRVAALLGAETVSEVGMLVHDLQLPGAPVAVPPPQQSQSQTPQPTAVPNPYASSLDYATLSQIAGAAPKAARTASLIGVIVVLVTIAGVGAGLVAATATSCVR